MIQEREQRRLLRSLGMRKPPWETATFDPHAHNTANIDREICTLAVSWACELKRCILYVINRGRAASDMLNVKHSRRTACWSFWHNHSSKSLTRSDSQHVRLHYWNGIHILTCGRLDFPSGECRARGMGIETTSLWNKHHDEGHSSADWNGQALPFGVILLFCMATAVHIVRFLKTSEKSIPPRIEKPPLCTFDNHNLFSLYYSQRRMWDTS